MQGFNILFISWSNFFSFFTAKRVLATAGIFILLRLGSALGIALANCFLIADDHSHCFDSPYSWATFPFCPLRSLAGASEVFVN